MNKEIQKQVDEAFDTYQKELNNLDVSDVLGSCQYKSIEDTYNWATSIINILGIKGFESLLGITYSAALTKDELEKELCDILKETQNEDDDDYKELQEILKQGTCPIEDYAELTRDLAWDLWSAYPVALKDFKMENKIELPTYGPIFNQMAQSENFEIGIHLAYITHLYGTDLDIWAGYDT